VLTLPPSVRIYLAVGTVDMRRGHDGLAAIIRSRWKLNLFGDHLFVFVRRCNDRCKILFWDRGGFVLYYKRLERGRLRVPQMAPLPDEDHDCGWRTRATDLEAKLAETAAKLEAVLASMAALERRFLGPKREKLPAMDREVKKKRPPDPAAAQVTRRKNAELRATRVVTEDAPHAVPSLDRKCPKCGGVNLRPVGTGKTSSVLDYVPGYFRRRQRIHETLACPCGDHIITAPGPDHSIEGARYGDSFRAFVAVSKCADAIPLYRQAKQMSRLGIPISRSTDGPSASGCAATRAVSKRVLDLVAAAEVVQADETSMKMQKPNKRGFV
jgi:transposase